MILIKLSRTYNWEILGFLLLAFVIWMNSFPAGHIILGADIMQPINMSQHFLEFHYEWLGRVSLFYGIFYLLDNLGVTSTGQISWYLAILLIGAYGSFLYFSSLIFPKSSHITRVLVALFYATNIYTLYIFTATWGYSHYQVLYIFIPALTGLYLKVLETNKNTHVIIFLLVAFLASTSFGNPAFALALGIYFFVLTVSLFLFRFVSINVNVIKRIVTLLVGALLLNAYWFLPILPQLRSGIESVYTSEFVDLTERLRKTSNAIYDTIRLLPTSEQNRYFPSNVPYTALSFLKQPLLFLAFLPILFILFGWTRQQDKNSKKLYYAFFCVLIIFIALVARVRFPFESINTFLFQLPGFNTLRGWDKLATFTPFLLSALMLILFVQLEGKCQYRVFVGIFFVMTILLSLPFYLGGIQTKMSYILSGQKNKNFSTSKQSALVAIPASYYDVAPFFASDQEDFKISMLPYSPGSSVGRVGLPAWKVNGPHPAHGLYTKQYVELNDYYLPGWLFAKSFNSLEHDPKWITALYGLIGVKYVFYHKDAKPESLQEFEALREYLVQTGELHNLSDNSSFILYQVDAERLFPYVYTSPYTPHITFAPEGLPQSLEEFRHQISVQNYRRNNPREIEVSLDSSMNEQTVFLNEKYDSLWRAEFIDMSGEKHELVRDVTVMFANAWRIPHPLENGKVTIYYSPIRLLYAGEWISGLSLLLILSLGIWTRRKNMSN